MPTLLLIDDNPLIADFVHLAVPEWQLIHAITGRKGLGLLREHHERIMVIVLDVGLPGMDGRLVCARIRSIAPDIPIVPFTGNHLADDELREMGCEPAVPKTAGPKMLAAALMAALKRPTPPPSSTPLLEFVKEYAAQLEQAENHASTLIDLPAERQPVAGTHLDDFDLQLVRQHIEQAVARRGYAGVHDPLAYLQQHFCTVETATGQVPTLAGLLLFTPNASRWISAAGVDLIQFGGAIDSSPQVIATEHVRGSLIHVINQAIDWLWSRIAHNYETIGSEQIETHAYPLAVLRELTINALCHRDWSYRGSMVRIQLFADQLEWITPGGLPTGVTTHNLRTAQLSRNPAITQLFYDVGIVERLGLGMDMVLDTLQRYGHPAPICQDDGHFFTIQLQAQSVVRGASALVPASERQDRILNELRRQESCSTAQLAELLGETLRTIQRELRELTDAGMIVAVGQTHNRRYRIRSPT